MRLRVRRGLTASGAGRSFPNFQTEAQQDLSTPDVNLLSSLSHWVVMNNAGLFTAMFSSRRRSDERTGPGRS